MGVLIECVERPQQSNNYDSEIFMNARDAKSEPLLWEKRKDGFKYEELKRLF